MRTLNLMPQRVVVTNLPGGTGGGGMLSNLFTGGRSYETAMRASRMGKFGMSRAMGMKGAGIGALGSIAGMGVEALADQYEEGSAANVGLGVAGGALQGAGTGAMIGSFIPGIGTAVGAGLGAAIGGLTAYLQKKDTEQEKEKTQDKDHFQKMVELLEKQADTKTAIYMDANQVGIAQRIGNPQLN
jgi:hypothetical protein